jgi:mannose-6-phosphate isomerase-like protein (cupin superfamily)
MVLPDNREVTRRVRVGDVVAAPVGTNFMTHSSEDGGRFGHAHIFLTNGGGSQGQVYYDVGGMLRLQSLGMMDPAPPGALPFSDITSRIEVKDWSALLAVHPDGERDLPSWLRRGWRRREATRLLDYAEGAKAAVVSSPDRTPNDFMEWGKGTRRCFVNPLIAEQMAAITDCRFPAGYKRLHPYKEVWCVLKGQARIKQSIPPLHGEWVEVDLQANDVMVAANGAHVYVLEATDDFVVRRLAETCAHNGHVDMMERKLQEDKTARSL